MKEQLNKKIELIHKELQERIDNGEFEWCSGTNQQLDLVDMEVHEFTRQVSKWDFNDTDNAIWYYTQLTTLEQVRDMLEENKEVDYLEKYLHLLWSYIPEDDWGEISEKIDREMEEENA